MKIAVFGGTGLLGSNLVENYLDKGYEVRAYSRKNSLNIDKCNNNVIDFLSLENELYKEFDIWSPDIIINTIAMVNLQICEDNYDLAHFVNVEIAKKLALLAKENKSYFIHISTDHYYSDLIIKHNETDDIVLLNNYAKTKYEAEKEILGINNKALIVRTNIIGYRRNGYESFFEWLLNSVREEKIVDLYENFMTSPIDVNSLGNILIKCFKLKIKNTYNIAASEVIDKYNFGIKTAKIFNYKVDNINKVQMINSNKSLNRATSLGLDVSKIENDLGIKMPKVNEVIINLYKEYKENNFV